MKNNIILNTDSYKVGMDQEYPETTTGVFSYIESRGGRYSETVMFGLQAFIKEYLLSPITKQDIDEAESIWTGHGEPFNRANWDYILNEHKGYLPVLIKAVPEGTVVPTGNVLLTIENTDPKCYWLTTWLETALLRAIWYPTTVATNSREIKKIILKFLDETGTPETIGFKLHDFGMRGVSSYESSLLGATAHLVNFMGTDTISGIKGARDYYNEPMAAFSIPASEHSISTAWGPENESGYVTQMLKFFENYDIVATVADTYDVFNYCKLLGTEFKDRIQALGEKGKTLVVRPDSGNPTIIPVQVIETLMKYFGFEINDKGYRVLPSYIRAIQGDGINADSIEDILSTMKNLKLSADNIAFGMGGQLLGAPQRDDQKFAQKASAVQINGEWIDIYKTPVTDPGKSSKKGRLGLIYQCGVGNCGYQTVPEAVAEKIGNELKTIYQDGMLFNETDFASIRSRAEVKPEEFKEFEYIDRY